MNKVIVTKFDSLWKLMREHRFTVDPDSIHDNLACVLCKEIMVDASQTPCGCQYCYQCIFDYLDTDGRYCPGERCGYKEDCLVRERDISRDPRSNNKILKLRVLCPNKSCVVKTELSNMGDHIRVCTKTPLLSCSTSKCEDKDSDFNQIHQQLYSHTENFMNDMKNDFVSLRESLENCKNEINSLKENLTQKDIEIRNLAGLREDLVMKENRIVTLERRLQEFEEERMMHVDEERLSILETKLINIIEDKTGEIDRKLIYYTNCKSLCPSMDVDFVWKVDNLSTKKREDRFSYAFCILGYTLSLCLNLTGDNIALWCYIMKGVYDDNVEWPMQHIVTLSILEQDNFKPCMTEKYQYDTYFYKYKWVFKKPTLERNNGGIGSHKFINYSTLRNVPLAIVNDSIVVSCCLDDGDSDTNSSSSDSYM